MTSTPLTQLADQAGIESGYWDVYGNHHETSDETRRLFLSAMGYAASHDDEVNHSLKTISERSWQRRLEPVNIIRAVKDIPHRIDVAEILIVLPDCDTTAKLEWLIDFEDGPSINGNIEPSYLNVVERKSIDGHAWKHVALNLPTNIPLGYHTVHITFEGQADQGALIVAPRAAYQPDWMVNQMHKVWGVACQLYSLKSESNWGIGDFSSLAELCTQTKDLGGDIVGIPPLHALFYNHPEWVSPYSPSSRSFLNPIYLSLPDIAEFDTCAEAKKVANNSPFADAINKAQATNAVDFKNIAPLKRHILQLLFADFTERYPPNSQEPRRQYFDAFMANGGHRLHNFAVFEALLDHFSPQLPNQWEPAYQDPASPNVQKFIQQNSATVEFHMYLQWLCDQQLSATCDQVQMKIGLYRDLAVGVSPDGADAWMNPSAFVPDVRFGAPPDPLGPMGQDWGMPPFNPDRLYETAYDAYIEMLRANMQHAGALRIDHVMWLQRMFWIPPGGDGRDGAYVRYPFDDLLAILALESRRHSCVVIGEALGTVTEGFRERLAHEGVLSYCLLQFERYEDGLYKRPNAYPRLALTTPASHDLPTLAGFWREQDIQVQFDVGILDSVEAANHRRQERSHERACLIAALADQNLISAEFPNTPNIDDQELWQFIIAVHTFLARTPSALMMVNLEDILKSLTQINVPGTVDEYPNWRLKLRENLNQISAKDGMADMADHLNSEQCIGAQKF